MKQFNIAAVSGHLSRAVEEVGLASGDVLCRYEVTVAREDERADTIPVVAVSPPSHARGLEAGTEVLVIGRTRRRFWSAGGATRSQVEILATTIIPTSRKAGAQRALDQLRAALEVLGVEDDG